MSASQLLVNNVYIRWCQCHYGYLLYCHFCFFILWIISSLFLYKKCIVIFIFIRLLLFYWFPSWLFERHKLHTIHNSSSARHTQISHQSIKLDYTIIIIPSFLFKWQYLCSLFIFNTCQSSIVGAWVFEGIILIKVIKTVLHRLVAYHSTST